MYNSKFAFQVISALTFSLFAINTYAIEVKVQSTSKKISALGFTVNGKKYGTLGKTYENKDAPKGNYKFGLRAGKDVGCLTSDGKKTVRVIKNTLATLKYDGKHCVVKISS